MYVRGAVSSQTKEAQGVSVSSVLGGSFQYGDTEMDSGRSTSDEHHCNPAKLEPPAGDADNCMSYVIAFEDDGVARDVTGGYARAFNSKTRKTRIESTPGGE